MTAHWTVKARHRLQQLHDHIANDQPENAQRFVDRLTRRADALAEHPLTGRVLEQYQHDDIREVYEGRYRMIYRVLPDPRGQITHAATVEFSGTKRVRESSCPQVTVSVTG